MIEADAELAADFLGVLEVDDDAEEGAGGLGFSFI